jgi:hypothetical protein
MLAVNPMKINRNLWIGLSAIVVLAAIVVGGNYIWKQNYSNGEIVAVAPLDSSCDLQKNPCQRVFPDGSRITLSILPRPFQPLQPLQIQVLAEGMDPRSVEVDFTGLGMYMGYNRPQLTRKSPGTYAGSGMLASCAIKRMAWEATVLAKTDEGVMAAPFRFEILNP